MKGFETFFEATKGNLNTKSDLIVATLHFVLIHELDFTCVGTGEQFPEPKVNEPTSELLPNGWNNSSDVYALRYISSRADIIRLQMKCVMAGDVFVITIIPVHQESNEVYSVSIKLSDFITDGPLKTRPRSQVFVGGNEEKLEKEFKKAFCLIRQPKKVQSNVTQSNNSNQQQRHPLMEPNQNPYFAQPMPGYANPYGGQNPFGQPFTPRIGGADLDPFNRGFGGGMLFDPFSGGMARNRQPMYPHLPRGAVPPGARFDPFGPPGTGGRFARPDPDHEPPPPGADDMFM